MSGGQEKAIAWLMTLNRASGGERPSDELDTDTGARMAEDPLWHHLRRLRFKMFR